MESELETAEKIYWLVGYCKRYGTLPFAGLARAVYRSTVAALYGGDAPERDEVERALIAWAMLLLGVCRGMQMILHYFATPLERVGGHIRTEHLLDDGNTVNSFHGWGARTCMPPLTALRTAPDGVIEAVRHTAYPWIVGIMWHPERYHPFRCEEINWMKRLFAI